MYDIIFFDFLSISDFWFPLPVRFLLLKSPKIFTVGKSAIIRWPPRSVTALQVVRTSFLGPRPRLSPPPPTPVLPLKKAWGCCYKGPFLLSSSPPNSVDYVELKLEYITSTLHRGGSGKVRCLNLNSLMHKFRSVWSLIIFCAEDIDILISSVTHRIETVLGSRGHRAKY